MNPAIGYGVFATATIPAGTITWVRDELDQTFSPEEVGRLPDGYRPILDKYCYVDGEGRMVLCWDLARFMNHSCSPTCLGAGYDFELAVRDIQPGEELTDDYGTLNLDRDFACHCGLPQCRRSIRPDDFERFGSHWDGIVEPVFRRINQVDQPLWPFLKEQKLVERVLARQAPLRSISLNYRRRI